MATDGVDQIQDQWRRECPLVDVSGMAIVGRITRINRDLRVQLDEVFTKHRLESWEFDVLATLRRHGAPFQLTAGQLVESMMVTSGAITHRLDVLERRGLISRDRRADDRRVVVVELTQQGLELVDAVLPDHAANEQRLVSLLSPRDREVLTAILRRYHLALQHDLATSRT
jgi:DNA-binding MarR family transcriptional regulator